MSLVRMITHVIEDPVSCGLPEGLLADEPLSVVGGSLGGINGGYFSSVDPRVGLDLDQHQVARATPDGIRFDVRDFHFSLSFAIRRNALAPARHQRPPT